MFAMGKVLQKMLKAMHKPDATDADSLALKEEMLRLAEACCEVAASHRPTAAEVQASPLYRQPPVQQAKRNDMAVQSLAVSAKHFSWEVQQGDGSWKHLGDEAARAVEVKYLHYLAAGARLGQQYEAGGAEDESKGNHESKGDDESKDDDESKGNHESKGGYGGPTGYNVSATVATLEDGSIISFRSPMICLHGDVEARVRRCQTDVYPFPEDWPQGGNDCELVPLPRDSEEFKAVEAVLRSDVYAVGSDMVLADPSTREAGEGMARAVVESVTRVQNKWQWERHCHHKRFMEQRKEGGDPNELWLWHGSYVTPPEVLCCGYDGVDFRRSSDGNFYGRGAYFAEQPRYSDLGYAYEEEVGKRAGFKQMILARVLCGEAKEMGTDIDRSIKVPPEGYDSIRGGPHYPPPGTTVEYSSHMRVVYDQACVYPAYIVRYSHAAE